jgi:hypothetical protein
MKLDKTVGVFNPGVSGPAGLSACGGLSRAFGWLWLGWASFTKKCEVCMHSFMQMLHSTAQHRAA